MARGGWGEAGQRETIIRGERTRAQEIVNQAKWMAFCFTFIVVAAESFYLWYIDARWYDIRHWLFELAVPVAVPFAFGALCAGVQLFIEIFDPMHPSPRKATSSTRPNFPWSKERGLTSEALQRSKIDKETLADLLALLEEESEE